MSETTTTTTISDFLLARIAEAEAAAVAVTTDAASGRNYHGTGWFGVDYNGMENEEHGRRCDPARVLAECEAKRWLIDIHRMVKFTDVSLGLRDVNVCCVCHVVLDFGDGDDDDEIMDRMVLVQQRFPCSTIRALASVYADHPDYQQEWRA